jgi:P27 family predicted phage terminase small subunit
MGRRGPKPKTHALRVLEGTAAGVTQGRLGDLMPSVIPPPPEWLSETELKVWRSVVNQLASVPGLLANVDQNAMGRYCADVVEYVQCRSELEQTGVCAVSEKGATYQHPVVGIRNQCHERMRRFEACFGMTAADRARLEVPNIGGPEDDLENMLA